MSYILEVNLDQVSTFLLKKADFEPNVLRKEPYIYYHDAVEHLSIYLAMLKYGLPNPEENQNGNKFVELLVTHLEEVGYDYIDNEEEIFPKFNEEYYFDRISSFIEENPLIRNSQYFIEKLENNYEEFINTSWRYLKGITLLLHKRYCEDQNSEISLQDFYRNLQEMIIFDLRIEPEKINFINTINRIISGIKLNDLTELELNKNQEKLRNSLLELGGKVLSYENSATMSE